MSKLQDRSETFQKIDWTVYKKNQQHYLIELRRSKRLAFFHKKRHSESCFESMNIDEVETPLTLQELLTPNTQFTPESLAMIMKTLKAYLVSNQIARVEEALNTVKTMMKYSMETLKCLSEFGVFVYVSKLISPLAQSVLIEKAAWIISDFFATEYSKVLIDTNLMAALISCLTHEQKSVSQHLLWALGNISAEEEFQELLIRKTQLITVLVGFSEDFGQTVAWILSNITKSVELMDSAQVHTVCDLIQTLFKSSDCTLITDSLLSLVNLSSSDNPETIQSIVDHELVHLTISTLKLENCEIRAPALKILGNICAVTHEHTQLVLNLNILDILSDKEFIYSSLSSDTVWILSNIAAGTRSQIDKLMSHKIFETLILCIVHYEMKTRIQAITAVKNLLKAEESCKERLAKMDFFSILNMAMKENDADYCKVLVEVCKEMFLDKRFEKMVEETGCVFGLEALAGHKNKEISEGVEEIIQLFSKVNKI